MGCLNNRWYWLHVFATFVLVCYGYVTTATIHMQGLQIEQLQRELYPPCPDNEPAPVYDSDPRTDGRDVPAPFNLDRTA